MDFGKNLSCQRSFVLSRQLAHYDKKKAIIIDLRRETCIKAAVCPQGNI